MFAQWGKFTPEFLSLAGCHSRSLLPSPLRPNNQNYFHRTLKRFPILNKIARDMERTLLNMETANEGIYKNSTTDFMNNENIILLSNKQEF